ncbi:hypothetical protein A8924_1868 [Saccharopolyspora erythraea NRRL 2338]|uniref:Uncharacterized protein n=2 Tax=Saccharopolyspora erythraea TaxID=1836 RepID=A4F9R8_SACEN|nr:hypothetical protein [Saccharopolyspora erythraea]EQD83399.1 hypothetical protein N599_25610 [Saccharopolyspora erythraea D]PFG94580.1 hypothetical protein A8924_1868 [Saccharopolyspora erythraea NRRL 2338]QRK91321.1 hypothetical protein JQX30_07905 [Saccharopolyspora erythraea]CAM00793.1 hypothetical protein SACE_1471 [Saccharopolyspora erythraea NRRL 2338]
MSVTHEDLHQLVERLPSDKLDDAASALAHLVTQDVELADEPVRDLSAYTGSFSAEPDLAQRTEEFLRDRFRGDGDTA